LLERHLSELKGCVCLIKKPYIVIGDFYGSPRNSKSLRGNCVYAKPSKGRKQGEMQRYSSAPGKSESAAVNDESRSK
jgi:hypothetical protein